MHALAGHGAKAMGEAHAAFMAPAATAVMTRDTAMPQSGHRSPESSPRHSPGVDTAHIGGAFAQQPDVARAAGAAVLTGLGTGAMDMGVGGAMCVAVLLLSLIALALQRHATRARMRVWWTLHRVQLPAGFAREPDPPNLHALSIQRC
jgi:hypothetical protein